MGIRIKGLVRTFNFVRKRLQDGIAPDEVAQFRRDVEAIVGQVEQICQRHNMAPHQLPAPSRNAYQFLKELNFDNLPLRRADDGTSTPRTLHMNNVVKGGDHFAQKMWRELDVLLRSSSPARAALQADMERFVSAVEQICARHGATPTNLETPSRQVYCWMKFLLSGDNLTAHLNALQRARTETDKYALAGGSSIQVHIVNVSSLWRLRRDGMRAVLKCSEGFLNADPDVWRALVGSALSRRTNAWRKVLDEFAESEEFSAVLFEMESFAEPPGHSTQGRVHDLKESFARVNAAYFNGAMPTPTLKWNSVLTTRTFGHYQSTRDTVMLSVSLDDESVPAFVVDFVMYHELLHKKHGVAVVSGRRIAHTPAFHAEERRFARYSEAEAHLRALARKQGG